jgi:hypothetical protein
VSGDTFKWVDDRVRMEVEKATKRKSRSPGAAGEGGNGNNEGAGGMGRVRTDPRHTQDGDFSQVTVSHLRTIIGKEEGEDDLTTGTQEDYGTGSDVGGPGGRF